jgi:hypothetical protein
MSAAVMSVNRNRGLQEAPLYINRVLGRIASAQRLNRSYVSLVLKFVGKL